MIKYSTVESVGNCLHLTVFLFIPLNLKPATFDLAKIKISTVKFEVVLAQSLYQGLLCMYSR